MRQTIRAAVGIAISFCLMPAGVNAQQRGTGGPVPMVAPTRAVPISVSPAITHAPIHATVPAAATHSAGHGYAPSAHPSAPRIPGHAVAPKAPAHNHPIPSNPTHRSGYPSAAISGVEDDNGVPGLGFDYPHYAATHPNAGRHHFQSGSVFPFIGGGIYVPSFGYFEGGTAAEPAGEDQSAETTNESAESLQTEAADQPEVVPQRRLRSNPPEAPPSEFVFVRRDGTVFFAVAYSWVNGGLQYVTQDGMRTLVSTTTLDLDATTQFNEQRGLAFHSPV